MSEKERDKLKEPTYKERMMALTPEQKAKAMLLVRRRQAEQKQHDEAVLKGHNEKNEAQQPKMTIHERARLQAFKNVQERKKTNFERLKEMPKSEKAKRMFLMNKKNVKKEKIIVNRILEIILGITSFIVVPVQLITTFVLSILISITFGLLLFPLSLVWSVLFLFPLIGLSYIYEKIPFIRILIAIIGIPIAILGNIYSALIPSMGDMESRCTKLLITESFPYSWHYYQLTRENTAIPYTEGFPSLLVFFNRVNYKDKRWDYINALKRANNI